MGVLEYLVHVLGQTGTGALLGGLSGALGAVLAVLVTSRATRGREAESRLFTERRVLYGEYLKDIHALHQRLVSTTYEPSYTVDEGITLQVRMLASPKVRSQMDAVEKSLGDQLEALKEVIAKATPDELSGKSSVEPTERYTEAHKQASAQIDTLEERMRRDLGGR